MSEDEQPPEQERRKATPDEQAELDRVVVESRKQVRILNANAEVAALAAGRPGDGVNIARGWVVHPNDRGARRRRDR